MNRTLVERVRCLLSHAGLPASFWGFGAAKMFHTIIYESLDVRHPVLIRKDKVKLDVKNTPVWFLRMMKNKIDDAHGANDVDAPRATKPNEDDQPELPCL
ncbi:hypothetical protein Tco_1203012 [Tanacetum coccineum]